METLRTKSIVSSNICIVDNEISNDISSDFSDWNYEKGDIILAGFLYKDEIVQILRKPEDSIKEFKHILREHLEQHKHRLYAFNWRMESGNFKGMFRKKYRIGEVKVFKGHGWSKDKFYSVLVENKNYYPLADPLNGDGFKVIQYYKQRRYNDILKHNYCCLVKEAAIHNEREWLFDRFKHKIDQHGWYQNEK